MAPRAMWTGQLRLSLVSFGVRLYSATESASRVSMNQLHRDCHQRVRNQSVCPVHGPIPREEIVKGYAYEKDTYVIIEPAEVEAIRLESKKTIDLKQFIKPEELDSVYINSPYYLGPDGPIAEEGFRVIRTAMERTGLVGIGTLVMSGREHVVALSVEGKGFMLATLRYAEEVRSTDKYFEDISEDEADEAQVELAETILEKHVAPFEPEMFKDHYRAAFFDMVKAKVEGKAPVVVEDEVAPSAFNFMDALRQSVDAATDEKTEAKPRKKKTVKKAPAASKKKPAPRSSGGKKTKSRKTGS